MSCRKELVRFKIFMLSRLMLVIIYVTTERQSVKFLLIFFSHICICIYIYIYLFPSLIFYLFSIFSSYYFFPFVFHIHVFYICSCMQFYDERVGRKNSFKIALEEAASYIPTILSISHIELSFQEKFKFRKLMYETLRIFFQLLCRANLLFFFSLIIFTTQLSLRCFSSLFKINLFINLHRSGEGGGGSWE